MNFLQAPFIVGEPVLLKGISVVDVRSSRQTYRGVAMLSHTQRQLRETLLTGLAHPDAGERRASASYIARQLLPALQDDQRETCRSSLAVLSRLALERRPPRDDFEDLGLDYAIGALMARRAA